MNAERSNASNGQWAGKGEGRSKKKGGPMQETLCRERQAWASGPHTKFSGSIVCHAED